MLLRDLRQARALSLQAAAACLAVDRGNLSRVERGVQVPGLDLAWRLAAFYELDARQLIAILYPGRGWPPPASWPPPEDL